MTEKSERYATLLTIILNCGYSDLSMFDDVGYDMYDIIEESKSRYGSVHFNDIMAVIFQKGLDDLEKAFIDNQNRIFDEIDEEIKQIKNDYKNDWLEDKDDEDWELSEEWDTSEYRWEVDDLERLRIDLVDFHPMYDGSYFTNYLDSHIYMPHLEFYRKYMGDEVAKVEDNMGISFEEID